MFVFHSVYILPLICIFAIVGSYFYNSAKRMSQEDSVILIGVFVLLLIQTVLAYFTFAK